MRPCNQCRRPVENNVLICEACQAWNNARADETNSTTNLEDNSKREHYADYSYAILMGMFSLVITGLFALVGAAVYGLNGSMLGGAIGLLVGVILFSVAIKM